MSRPLARARAAQRRLHKISPPESPRDRLVCEVAEQIVAQQSVGDVQAALAAHPLFSAVGDDGEMPLDVLLEVRRQRCPEVDFMCIEVDEPDPFELEIRAAISRTPDERRRYL